MKIGTGTDTNILTTDDLQKLQLCLDIKPSSSILKGYGGNRIDNLSTTSLKLTHKCKSVNTNFKITSGSPRTPINDRLPAGTGTGYNFIITVHIQELTATQEQSKTPHPAEKKNPDKICCVRDLQRLFRQNWPAPR